MIRRAIFTFMVLSVVLLAAARGQTIEGLKASPLSLSPFSELSAVYDSNIDRLSTDEEDATFFDAEVGLRLGYNAPDIVLDGTGFLGQRLFTQENDERGFATAGEVLSLRYGSPDRFVIGARETYRKVEDRDTLESEAGIGDIANDLFLDADVRGRREVIGAGVFAEAQPTDKIDANATYRYTRTVYSMESLFDIDAHTAQLETGHQLTDKTAVLATVLGGIQKSESVDDAADYSAARLGLRMRGSDKLNFKAGCGYQNLNRPEAAATEDGVQYDAVMSWDATDKTTFQFEGRNGLQLSSIHRANVVDKTTLRLGVLFRMTPALALTADGLYRIDDYVDPVLHQGEVIARKDKGSTLRLRADYRMPFTQLRLFTECLHEDVDSTIRDYKLTRVNLGLNIEI